MWPFLNPGTKTEDVKNALEAILVPMLRSFHGFPEHEAREMFHTIFSRVRADAIESGTLSMPLNAGDLMLAREKEDPALKARLAKKRADGVRDEDIRRWWNSHDLERRLMLAMSETSKFASYLKMTEGDHLTHEEATSRLHKYWPSFGGEAETDTSVGEDRALPYELKLRLNDYVDKVGVRDFDDLKERAEKFSSFNAFVRSEIETGRL